MSHQQAILSKEEYFNELKQTPFLSIPAMAVFVLGFAFIFGGSYLAIIEAMPMWGAILTNGFGIYLFFSVSHESLHRTLSSNKFLNDTLGRIALLFFVPAAPLEVTRWAHFLHHRFTSSAKDPDEFIHHGSKWTLVLRWTNFDLNYLRLFFVTEGNQVKKHGVNLTITLSTFVAAVLALIYYGYGMEVLFFWFLPSRISLFFVALIFVFLPHYPANVSSAENEYQASTIRKGCEWLLTPLFVYQNYHLIHHLYPTVPFYNYIKIWHLKYDELIAENPAMQTAFGLMPINANNDKGNTNNPD